MKYLAISHHGLLMNTDLKGIILRIGATLFFSIMVLFIKMLADDVPVGQIVFYRSAIALPPLVAFLMIGGDFPSGLRTKRPMGHLVCGLCGCIAMFASFASLKYLPMADATIIGFLAPIFTVIMARLFLSEIVTGTRWFGVVFGFIGMLVLIIPQLADLTVNSDYMLGVGLGLMMAFFAAIAKIQIRRLAQTEHAGAIAFYFALICALAGLLTLPLGWVNPSSDQLLLLIGSGFTGGVAHIMMTLSFQYSESSKLATFEYLMLGFAVILDVVFFQIIPQWHFYLSSMFIILATLTVALEGKRIFSKRKSASV